MTLEDFKATMFLMNWHMKTLPKIEDEEKVAVMWQSGESTVWWSMDMDGRWSFLHAPKDESLMTTYYTFEEMLKVLGR